MTAPHDKPAYRIASYREAIAELPPASAWAADLEAFCEIMYGIPLAEAEARVAATDFTAIESALKKCKKVAERDLIDLGMRDWLASLSEWKIIILEGDAEFNTPLDLCRAETYFPEYAERTEPDILKNKWFILVKGNLKAGNIFCSREYGACNLAVTGDLSVRNLAVCGEHEICVGGRLNVGGLFLGNDASGSLNVGRSICAQVFVAGSGYITSIDSGGSHETPLPHSAQAHDGAHGIRHCLRDWDLPGEAGGNSPYRRIAAAFRPAFLRPEATVSAGGFPPSSWTEWLDYPAIVQALAADGEVVHEAG